MNKITKIIGGIAAAGAITAGSIFGYKALTGGEETEKTPIAANTPENTPTNTPTTPENTPANTPENTPTNTPENTPENTPSPTPEPTPSVPRPDVPGEGPRADYIRTAKVECDNEAVYVLAKTYLQLRYTYAKRIEENLTDSEAQKVNILANLAGENGNLESQEIHSSTRRLYDAMIASGMKPEELEARVLAENKTTFQTTITMPNAPVELTNKLNAAIEQYRPAIGQALYDSRINLWLDRRMKAGETHQQVIDGVIADIEKKYKR